MEFITRNYYEIMGFLLLAAFIKGYLIITQMFKENINSDIKIGFVFHFLNTITYVVTGVAWLITEVYCFFDVVVYKWQSRKKS
ncbi:hypothetical protein [Flavobacterium fluviatile]|uniref:hypothetical protein n=1 Tax=Flavobacterium fluviatile TaxID=1862387 RepID=UPI001AD66B81|nr:hypothetical protein [Flavobacterium fluviatile]